MNMGRFVMIFFFMCSNNRDEEKKYVDSIRNHTRTKLDSLVIIREQTIWLIEYEALYLSKNRL